MARYRTTAARRAVAASALLTSTLLGAACTSLPERLNPPSPVICDGAERPRVDCSASRALRSQVLEVNAGLAQIGLGFEGKYETHALQQVRESTEHLALNLESMCEDYNACVLDRESYTEETGRIRELLSRHLRLATEQRESAAPLRGDELWSNARPDLARARLSLVYRVEVQSGGEFRVHRSGETLHTGDEIRFRLEPSRPAFVYVLLLSSQGTSARLFPLPELGLNNPLPAGASVTVPPPEGVRLQLDAHTGVEHLQIVASSTPLDGLAAASAPPPPGARAEGAQAPRVLREVGQLLCPEGTERTLDARTSSVACNGRLDRGLQLTAAAATPGSPGEQTLLAAQPNDDVVVFQHEIVHR
jgi:hypothetical protein